MLVSWEANKWRTEYKPRSFTVPPAKERATRRPPSLTRGRAPDGSPSSLFLGDVHVHCFFVIGVTGCKPPVDFGPGVTPALFSSFWVAVLELLAAVEPIFGVAPAVGPLPASFVDTAPFVGPLPASPFDCANAGADTPIATMAASAPLVRRVNPSGRMEFHIARLFSKRPRRPLDGGSNCDRMAAVARPHALPLTSYGDVILRMAEASLVRPLAAAKSCFNVCMRCTRRV